MVNESNSKKSLTGPIIAIIAGMFMVALDSSILNIAIPSIVKYFGSALSVIQWSITGYALALAAVIPLAGWMTDRFGTKRIFIIVIALFTIGSVLCSMATSPFQLILFRVIQGIGGGMVMPIGLATVFKMAPKDKVSSFMGLLGMPIMLAPTLGPVVFGYILQYYSWHWIFRINVPIGIISIAAAAIFLPEFERKVVPSLDIFGMILAPISFASLVYAVNEGSKSWGSINTIAALTLGSMALVIFILVELKQKQPLIELKVFGSYDFSFGIVVLSIFQIVLFSVMILTPLFIQNVKGFTTLHTGLMILPETLAAGIIMPFSGKLSDKIGPKLVASIGVTIAAIVAYLLSRVTVDTSVPYIMTCLVAIGCGSGLVVMPLNSYILQAAPKDLVSRVTPLTGAFQQIVYSFAIAGMTGFSTSQIAHHSIETKDKISVAISSYSDTFLLCAGIAIVGIILSLFIRKSKIREM